MCWMTARWLQPCARADRRDGRMTLSRRNLIHLVGKVGGVAAAYHTMAAMGLLPVPEAYAGPPALPPGKGRKIVIIGAGIAGMVLARELRKAGYAPLVLEARTRPGGRNWSLRAGDEVRETNSVQRVDWDRGEHMYFNPGPARLPYHHQGILSYCRELAVPLEVMCNDNRGALMQSDASFDGKRQLNRQVENDIRGYVAELAAKTIDSDALNQMVGTEDKERMRAMLRSFGALDRDMTYRGSGRTGYSVPPGGGTQAGTLSQPLELPRILASDFWQYETNFGEGWNQAATMMQPVGGMGRIGEAFGRALHGTISYGTEVTALHRSGDGARVVWRDAQAGREHATETPLVVITVPLPVLRNITADFSPDIRAAIAAVDSVAAGKVAFQAERRFWELDDAIYGGISWTSRDITQIWYPSSGIHENKAVLVGAYIWSDDVGQKFASKSPALRVADAFDDGERLHPGYRRYLTKGVSVAWKNIPYSGAAWAEWSRDVRAKYYGPLLHGDGPFLFAGEHMSYINGWQEGAVRSAHYTLGDIAQRIREAG
jgi:monoamine oxidase